MSAFKDAFREIFHFLHNIETTSPFLKYTLLSTLTLGSSLGLLTLLKKYYFNGPLVNPTYLKPQPLNKYENKIAILTGGTIGGLGFETAKELLKLGMTVILPLRNCNEKRLEIDNCLQKLKTIENKNVKYELMEMDLSDLESVKNFVKNFKLKYNTCDFLINNAGVSHGKHSTTKQGIESHFGINHLGHFLLTNLLLDLLKNCNARIINMSARANEFLFKKYFLENQFCNFSKIDDSIMGEYKEIGVGSLYARSKLCNILFTKKLNRILMNCNGVEKEGNGVVNNMTATTFSLHPGMIYTNIQGNYLNGNYLLKNIFRICFWPFCKDLQHGIQTTLHCVLAPLNELKSGAYYMDCKESKTYNVMVDDLDLQERVWNISLELCKSYLN